MATVTYAEVGATAGELPAGYHHVRSTRVIGHGRERFERASDDLFAGLVQRRAGARIRLSDVPLREEIALQKLYLDIEGVRFPHRLRAEYAIPEALEEMFVPGMILQPLVENSVKHAVAPTSGQVTITLAAREEYGRLVVTVSDNGQPLSASSNHSQNKGISHGIGLGNVRERLEARFGAEYVAYRDRVACWVPRVRRRP